MKKTLRNAATLWLIASINNDCLIAFAQGTAFSYQGRLNSAGTAYTGNVELEFTLWDGPTNGTLLAATSPTSTIVGASNGLFLATVDFGGAFPATNRWLAIDLRTAIGPFTTVWPRQQLTPVPSAMFAATASHLSGTVSASQIAGGVLGNAVLPTSPNFSGAVTAGSFAGNGANLSDLNASNLASGMVADAQLAGNLARTNEVWLLNGNAGTNPTNTMFLGTADNQPLELRVNGQRAFRCEPTGVSLQFPNGAPTGAPNLIGGSMLNSIAAGTVGATIAGGGATNYGGVLYSNTIGVWADFSTISGGAYNAIQTTNLSSVIGGGAYNTISSNSSQSVISGGLGNTINNNAARSYVGGGWFNVIGSSFGVIGGGSANNIAAYSSVIGGGQNNVIQANAPDSVVGGGSNNQIQVGATAATIPGGSGNMAGGNFSFAAGNNASARAAGAFVWADSLTNTFDPLALSGPQGVDNSFNVRSTGGFYIATGVNNSSGQITAGTYIAGGATSWSTLSDRNAKKDFAPVNYQAVLDKLAAVPVEMWHYKWEKEADVLNVGPMAQDFKHAFYPGRDDRSITTLEFDGVELAAIQGLNQKLQAQKAENAELRTRLEKLEQLMAAKLTGAK